MDLYVVQADERYKRPNGTIRRNNYCGGPIEPQRWWSGGVNKISPPKGFVPPRDKAPDLLFLGRRGKPYHKRFRVITMKHREPGCGYYVKKFDDHSLVLAQGGFVRPGHQLLLQW